MSKTHLAACLFASALIAVPALAQTTGAGSTAPGATMQPGTAGGAAPGAGGTAGSARAGSTGSAGGGAPGTVTASGMGANMNFITRRDQGVMRASELIGKDVYGANNEDIGEVDDVLINRNGQVVGVVVGVGGFLGLGETNVAVPLNALQFRAREANRGGTGTGGAASTTGAAGAGGTAAGTSGSGATASGATRGGGAAGTAGTSPGATGTADNTDVIVLVVTKEQLNSAPKFQDDARGRSATTGSAGSGTGAAPAPGAGTAPKQ